MLRDRKSSDSVKSGKRGENELLNSMLLTGRIALVTGAGSKNGIGFATAKYLSALGAKVAITSTTDRIFNRAAELSNSDAKVVPYVADLTDITQVKYIVQDLIARHQHIDILVNNAGLAPIGKEEIFSEICDLSQEEWQFSLNVNLNTTFYCMKAVIPYMKMAGYGRIINISSVTGSVVSNPREAGYATAKAALLGLTKSAAIELARSGITVNSVAPGWIATDASTPEELAAGRNTPIGRSGTPDEIASLIAYLASESSSYITGEQIVIDGGNTIQDYKGPSESYY
jgi:3-oxoacyl-[acyl-carrier protein] reductase